LLGMAVAGEDPLGHFRGHRADLAAPFDDPRRSPLQIPLVGFGPVGVDSGVTIRRVGPGVRGDALALMEDLDGGGGGPDLHLALGELVGYAVPVAVELDVIVDVDAYRLPLAVLVALGRQRLQRRAVQGFKQGFART